MSEMECFIVEAPDATWDNLFRNAQELYPVGVSMLVRRERERVNFPRNYSEISKFAYKIV